MEDIISENTVKSTLDKTQEVPMDKTEEVPMDKTQEEQEALPDVVIRSKDGKEFTIPRKAANHCGLLRDLLEDTADFDQLDPVIPLDGIGSDKLTKVVQYLLHHQNDPIVKDKDEAQLLADYRQGNRAIDNWDFNEFFEGLSDPFLIDLLAAAIYLDYTAMQCATAKMITEHLKNYNVEGIRKLFGVTPPNPQNANDAEKKTTNE